jgi:hypothetical protein
VSLKNALVMLAALTALALAAGCGSSTPSPTAIEISPSPSPLPSAPSLPIDRMPIRSEEIGDETP